MKQQKSLDGFTASFAKLMAAEKSQTATVPSTGATKKDVQGGNSRNRSVDAPKAAEPSTIKTETDKATEAKAKPSPVITNFTFTGTPPYTATISVAPDDKVTTTTSGALTTKEQPSTGVVKPQATDSKPPVVSTAPVASPTKPVEEPSAGVLTPQTTAPKTPTAPVTPSNAPSSTATQAPSKANLPTGDLTPSGVIIQNEASGIINIYINGPKVEPPTAKP
jgi:hypothetical protein